MSAVAAGDPFREGTSWRPRVVLIDDTEDFRLLLSIGLVAEGFEIVGEAGDGLRGVDVTVSTDPDLVLLDLAMPGLDGLGALELLRSAAPRAKVVVLSGFGRDVMEAPALRAGASGYVQKGAHVRDIAAAAYRALGVVASSSEEIPTRRELREGEVERLRQVLASAAHELRTPASVVGGLAEQLLQRGSRLEEPATSELLQAIHRQARVLDRITGDLLASSQAERGSIRVELQRVDLRSVITFAMGQVRDLSQWTLEIDPGQMVLADPVHLQQIFNNLVSNAIKYGKPPYRVHLEQGRRPDRPLGSVSVIFDDSGPGVPVEFEQKLFDPYSRAPEAQASGSGLGLYVVRELARAQRGDAVYMRSPGGGARFVVILPLAAPEGPR